MPPRGRKPIPIRLKIIRGNPGKRRLNAREPLATATAPHRPEWLNERARAVWAQVVPELAAAGVLTVMDRDALAAYCHIFVRWRDAEDFIAKHGEVYPVRDEHGSLKYMAPFPQVIIARHLLHTLRLYQAEFGMTPSSRSRIQVPHGTPPRQSEFF